jgi:hypothetical protein
MTLDRYKNKGGWGVDGKHTPGWKFVSELNVTSLVDEGNQPEQLNGNQFQHSYNAMLAFDPPWKPDHVLQVRMILQKGEGSSNCLGIRTFELRSKEMTNKGLRVAWAVLTVGLFIVIVFGIVAWWYYQGRGPEGQNLFSPEREGYESVPRFSDEDSDESDNRFGVSVPPIASLFSAIRQTPRDQEQNEGEYLNVRMGEEREGTEAGMGSQEHQHMYSDPRSHQCFMCGHKSDQ